jgi:hypothetical protein
VNPIEISEIQARTPHNEGLYEAGKALLVGSVDVGRDFCKSMITVASAAIPVYAALLALAIGKEFRPSFGQGVVLTLAPVALLLSATTFAIGYFPTTSTFSLDVPSEIEVARKATVSKRLRWSYIGFALFVMGIALSLVGVYYGLSLEVPAKTHAG